MLNRGMQTLIGGQSLALCVLQAQPNQALPVFAKVCNKVVLACTERDAHSFKRRARKIKLCPTDLHSSWDQRNLLIAATDCDWLLFLQSGEDLHQDDWGRLAHLMNHPIAPAYELPLIITSASSASPGASPSAEISVPRLRSDLRLFRRDAELYFEPNSNRISCGVNSSLKCEPIRCNVPIYASELSEEQQPIYDRVHLVLEMWRVRFQRDDSDARVAEGYAMALMHQSMWVRAIPVLERAIHLVGFVPRLNTALAYARLQVGDTATALRGFEEVVVRSPDFYLAYLNIGVIHLHEGRFAEALNFLKQAVFLNGDDALSHYNLGICYSKMKNLQAAHQHLKRALLLNQGAIEWHSEFANLCLFMGRYDEALDVLTKLTVVTPAARVKCQLGVAQIKTGLIDEGVKLVSEWLSGAANSAERQQFFSVYPELAPILRSPGVEQ